MLRSVLLCIFITTTTSGCSAIAPLAKDALLGGAKQGIEARANISKGDAEGQDSVAQNANTAVSLDAGSRQDYGAVDTVINESGLPFHVLLLLVLLAGWAIPSPEEMGHGLVRLIRGIRSTGRG
jgi:uncharacterized protein YceK